MSSEAFVTLATNDGYALGALVLAQSIRKVGTQRRLAIMVSKNLSGLMRRTIDANFDDVFTVEELNSNDAENLKLLSRPELGVSFTKINCWQLERYSKCVFLDADIVVVRNIDDLFEREEFSAAPDAGWPDCFNSGVFVLRPSKETFTKLVQFASQAHASFDGGDQGLLNSFFSNWRSSDISRHIPFVYNVTANTFYTYVPAVTRFRNDIRVIHFAGSLKPWHLTFNSQNEQLSGNLEGQHETHREFLLCWWRVMYERVWPQLAKSTQLFDQSTSGIESKGQGPPSTYAAATGSLLNYSTLTNEQGFQAGSAAHRRAWEAGHIDYHGRDSFTHIQEQLEKNIAHQQQQPTYHPSQQSTSSSATPSTGQSEKESTEKADPTKSSASNVPGSQTTTKQ